MKPIEMYSRPTDTTPQQPCCGGQKNPSMLARGPQMNIQALQSVSDMTRNREPWITGMLNTLSGMVPVVATGWTGADRWGQVRSRISAFRDNYLVRPGLYAVGTPDASSDIFVSANYKLSFDILRRSLAGMSGWILVLDTKGINVWCAAGKGTFGTGEIVKRVLGLNLAGLVAHRRLVVPQLGATGVNAAEVKKKTGFSVRFGPVDAKDIREYIEADYKASQAMRTVRFTLADRLVLVPIELNQALKRFPLVALAILIIFGIERSGIMYGSAWSGGWPVILLCLTSVLAGAFVTPALLPIIPFRSFALKGLAAGAAIIAPLVLLTSLGGKSPFLKASELTLFPLMSSYLALQFTGATTFTTISGVKKELKLWLPVYIAGLTVTAVLVILYKLQSWGII